MRDWYRVRWQSRLYELGFLEQSLGHATGTDTGMMLRKVTTQVPVHVPAMHCNDTYGQALANILTALQVRSLNTLFML
ncbi:3-hydroxy-3-methylglutaryl-CoA lyase, cytoplasmic [Tachysurus ichikawai]